MTIDYTTAGGQVRLLISDTIEATPIFTDAQILGFLGMRGLTAAQTDAPLSTVKRTAADALDTIATSEALIGKVMQSQDLQTDGAKLADSIRKHAAALRAEAATSDDVEADVDEFEIAEFTPWPVIVT